MIDYELQDRQSIALIPSISALRKQQSEHI